MPQRISHPPNQHNTLEEPQWLTFVHVLFFHIVYIFLEKCPMINGILNPKVDIGCLLFVHLTQTKIYRATRPKKDWESRRAKKKFYKTMGLLEIAWAFFNSQIHILKILKECWEIDIHVHISFSLTDWILFCWRLFQEELQSSHSLFSYLKR